MMVTFGLGFRCEIGTIGVVPIVSRIFLISLIITISIMCLDLLGNVDYQFIAYATCVDYSYRGVIF